VSEESRDKRVCVRVEPLPAWLDRARFLGSEFVSEPDGVAAPAAEALLTREAAAQLCARLRGLGLDGTPLHVTVTPPLARPLVRAGRLAEARARRETTPAFSHPAARASSAGRYSLTPEALAMSLAAQVSGQRVVDACAGSGGNALAFARAGCDVVAIELDAARLAEAAHNAAVYGVSQRIRFVQGDARTLLGQFSADLLFIDPPWGESYDKRATTREDFPLLEALLALPAELRARYTVTWLKLPASFATRGIPGLRARAVFGEARGDYRRIKFILGVLGGGSAGLSP
jgi:SAM-dependent methyltransferase